MANEFLLKRATDPAIELLDRIQVGFAFTENAEEGTVATSTVVIEDPLGDIVIPGLYGFLAYEGDISGSTSEKLIYRGYTAERKISRGEDTGNRTGASRIWSTDIVDQNTLLSRRIFTGSSANRPSETDVERIEWLMTTPAMSLIDNSDYINTDGGVTMDAADYRGQTGLEVLNDCMQASGKNGWVMYLRELGNVFGLWYDFADSEEYSSTISISNVDADVDGETVFYASIDATLERSPSRVFSGVYMNYEGGNVYVEREETADEFYPRDTTSYSPNVKSSGVATARSNRYLDDIKTEEDRITVSIEVRSDQANLLLAGHRVPCKFSHLPGYEDYAWMRALNRTITKLTKDRYRITVELSADGGVYRGPAFAALLLSNSSVGDLYYFTSGDDVVVPGWFLEPSVGPLLVMESETPFLRIKSTAQQPMSVRVELVAAFAQVADTGASVTLDLTRTRGGVTTVIASETVFYPDMGLGYWSVNIVIDESGVILEPGDILGFAAPFNFWTNFTTNDTYMRVGRGTFVWDSGLVEWTGG